MPKTEEGLSYLYEKGVLTFRSCPVPVRSLNVARIDAGGPIHEIRVAFDAYGAPGSRFYAIQEIILPDTLRVFPKFEAAFTKISQLQLPASCKKFPEKAFQGWKKLKEISIPEGVSKLPDGIFSGCSNLQCVHLPDSVTSLGKEAFRNCSKLSGKLVLPKKLTAIGDQAFSGCKNIEEVVFPDTLTSIGTKAFKGCVKLLQADLPVGIQIQKDSFPEESRLLIGGAEYVPKPERVEAKLSPIYLYDVDVNRIRSELQDGQCVEIHAMLHHFVTRLEVLTPDGKHVGFLAESSVKTVTRLKRIQPGQAFEASVSKQDSGDIAIVFLDNAPFRPTSFPERTHCLDWSRPEVDSSRLPLGNVQFQFRLKAEPYRLLSERDSSIQRDEYARAFSEEAAQLIYREESMSKYLYARSEEEISRFWTQYISMTLLEHIPLGTEFEAKIDSVRIQVSDDSWGAMHAGGMADYAYSVPAIVFFWRGIRVAYAPLIGRSDSDWNRALLVFWKWSRHTEWKSKAWLVQVTDAPECVFQVAFFPGTEKITGSIDLSEAIEYEGGGQSEALPLETLFCYFAKAERIRLCADEAGRDGIMIQQGESFYQLPVGMYELCELSRDELPECGWHTMDELEELA